MMQLYLTSNFVDVADQVTQDINLSQPKTAFIYTAAEESYMDSDWFCDTRNSLIEHGYDLHDYTVTDKKKENIEKFLETCDIIFIIGGNTFHLLEQSRLSGFDDILKLMIKSKIFIGQSAGSVLMGTSVALKSNPPETSLKDFTGLSVIDAVIVPHWGNVSARDSKKALFDDMYDLCEDIILLQDSSYIFYNGENLELRR